jgi:hypothetical protein
MRFLTSVAAAVLMVAGAFASATNEIESLLQYVGGLEGASFVRNGESHSAQDAVQHFRMKWCRQSKAVETAEDFIRLCATKSSKSGQAYLIKFKDGAESESAQVLEKQLKVIREKDAAGAQAADAPAKAP